MSYQRPRPHLPAAFADAHASFASAKQFRAWLTKHHAAERELFVRLHKVYALVSGMGYSEALDEALCFGWIDGVRRALDADSFSIRFTPRKKRSIWSAVNIKRVAALEAAGRMHASGRAAFAKREETRDRRLDILIDRCARGVPIEVLRRDESRSRQ